MDNFQPKSERINYRYILSYNACDRKQMKNGKKNYLKNRTYPRWPMQYEWSKRKRRRPQRPQLGNGLAFCTRKTSFYGVITNAMCDGDVITYRAESWTVCARVRRRTAAKTLSICQAASVTRAQGRTRELSHRVRVNRLLRAPTGKRPFEIC